MLSICTTFQSPHSVAHTPSLWEVQNICCLCTRVVSVTHSHRSLHQIQKRTYSATTLKILSSTPASRYAALRSLKSFSKTSWSCQTCGCSPLVATWYFTNTLERFQSFEALFRMRLSSQSYSWYWTPMRRAGAGQYDICNTALAFLLFVLPMLSVVDLQSDAPVRRAGDFPKERLPFVVADPQVVLGDYLDNS